MSLLKLTVLAWLVAALLSACSAHPAHPAAASASKQSSGAKQLSGAVRPGFGWLAPGSPPRAWSRARLRDGAVLAYPASWRRIRSDSGSVSAARIDRRSGLIADYLNATPQQGDETLQNWTTFRPAHNAEEGDSQVQVLAAAHGLPFRAGRGSCVVDRYRTPVTTYQEIACLVRGPRSTNVVVAATRVTRWSEVAPTLERAVSAFAP